MKMNRMTRCAILVVAVAAVVTPVALGGGPSNPGNSAAHKPTTAGQPGPNASLPAKAKAYGRYCQNQSKQHVTGQKGTPFSQCVTAIAKLASGQTNTPRAACVALSKKHVAGEQGTPFSRCVVAAAKLLKDQHK
jgi:hypothetical protein